MYLEQELPTHTPPPPILINHKNIKFILEQSSTL